MNNLMDKAWGHLASAKLLFRMGMGDENVIANAAYFSEQAVELAMKFALEVQGINYPRTHQIEMLISIAKEENADLFLTEYIEDHAEMFSSWEAKTRYIVGYLVEAKKVEKALTEIETYLLRLTEGLNTIIGH